MNKLKHLRSFYFSNHQLIEMHFVLDDNFFKIAPYTWKVGFDNDRSKEEEKKMKNKKKKEIWSEHFEWIEADQKKNCICVELIEIITLSIL